MRQTSHTLAATIAPHPPSPAAEGGAGPHVPADVETLLARLAGPDGQADPYPIYEQLRAHGEAVAGPGDSLFVTGYRRCSAILREPRLRKHPGRLLVASGFPDWEQRPALRLMFASMLMLNPPEHTRLRTTVARAFTARRVAALRPAVESIADRLLAGLSGNVDFVETVAFPFPVAVIGELLGVPEEDRPMFRRLVGDWTEVLEFLSPPAVDRADRAAAEIVEYFGELVARRRREPRGDLISALACPASAGPGACGGRASNDQPTLELTEPAVPLTDEELVRTAALIFGAGFETTTSLLANGLVALLAHPAQAARLAAEPELAKPAVEELLRYDSPVQMIYGRTAVDDVVVDDLELHAGQRVVTVLGAANRDPAVFTDPGALILDRAEGMPLSFGAGIHHCLGAALARLEGQIMLPRLLRAFPGLRLAGKPVRRTGNTLRGYRSLPVALG